MSSDDEDKPLVPSSRATPSQTVSRSTEVSRPSTAGDSSDDEPLVVNKAGARTRKAVKKEEEEESEDDEPILKPKTTKKIIKKIVKKTVKKTTKKTTKRTIKKTSAANLKKAAASPAKKRQRSARSEVEEDDATKARLNFKGGQKFLCPPMGDGTRAFYESLLKENPNSVMANKFCIEHGVLIGTQHKEQWLRYQQLKDLGGFRGAFGGIRLQFRNGILEKDLQTWKKMQGKNGSQKR